MLFKVFTDKWVKHSDEYDNNTKKQFALGIPELRNLNQCIPDERAIPPVDVWIPEEEDNIFKSIKGKQITAPLAKMLTNDDEDMAMFDTFILSVKKCYCSEKTVDHFVHYLNYLEKFFDPEKELLVLYGRYKLMIDTDVEDAITTSMLMEDIKHNILFSTFALKVRGMNEQNYMIHIDRNKPDGNVLQYSNRHIMALMEVSLFQIILIPILIHFAYRKGIRDIDGFLMPFYDVLLHDMHTDMDLINKLTETVNSRIVLNQIQNEGSWEQQLIRSLNKYTHRNDAISGVIIQVIPKFRYDQNFLNYIYVAINSNITHKVVNAKYEFAFKQLSSDRNDCDDDDNSEFDKFESHLAKKNESLLMHNQANFEFQMKMIDDRFGPFSKEEIEYYKIELSRGRKSPIVPLQKTLVCYLFYKWFGDPSSLGSMNLTDYIKLIIAAKRILSANGLHTMEAIISGKFVKVINRVNMNKKELTKITSSDTYKTLSNIYKNEKIDNTLLSILAIIIASKFQIIDFENKEMTGQPYTPPQELLNEEFLRYASLINNGCSLQEVL